VEVSLGGGIEATKGKEEKHGGDRIFEAPLQRAGGGQEGDGRSHNL